MKLELRKEYSPTLKTFVYRIYKDKVFIDVAVDLEKAKELFNGYEIEFNTPPEIILSKEIQEKK